MNKKILTIIILVILAGAGGFYGGMKYQENKNFSSQQRQQMFRQSGANASGVLAGGRGGANGAAGEIIAKDDKSITVKLQDARLPDGQGGSKIIFFSTSTVITKSANGSLSDLEVGKTVFVGGTQNSDGSVTAQTIQLRPTTP